MAFVQTAASAVTAPGASAGEAGPSGPATEAGPSAAEGARFNGRLCRDGQVAEEASIAVHGQYGSKV